MKLVFYSNFFNHHQEPLAQEFIKLLGEENYKFITTEYTRDDMNHCQLDQKLDNAPCVLQAYKYPEKARELINKADCVIISGLPVGYVSERLASGKLTFMQSERFLKGPFTKDLMRLAKYYLYSGGRRAAKNPTSKFYLLCSSGFAAHDYKLCGLFKNKAYKWGYFPEVKRYDDINELISHKKQASIVWISRLIDWKHPELSVILARNLKAKGINFTLKIIGDGYMKATLESMINEWSLNDCVELTGLMKINEVRAELEKTQISLLTSDRGEGWGAVLNESMNSACVSVAAEKIGAVPFMLQDNNNGLIFRDKDADDLTEKVLTLLNNPGKIQELGRNAYNTIINDWTPELAAKRFITLWEALNNNEEPVNVFESGLCSKIS